MISTTNLRLPITSRAPINSRRGRHAFIRRIRLFVAAVLLAGLLAVTCAFALEPPSKPQYKPARIEIIVYADFPQDPKHWDTLAEFLVAKGITAVEERMDKLDVCRKHGLKVRLGGSEAFPHLARLKDDPAVLGYFLGDNSEPKHYAGFAQMLRKMEELDPNHPALYIQTSDYGKLPKFVEMTRPMTINNHHYHWFKKGHLHFFYLKESRDLAQKYGSTQMRTLSSGVTPVQLRQSLFCAVAYGVTDFHFWAPWLVGHKKEKDQLVLENGRLVPTITAQGEAISAASLDLKWIGPVIVKLRNEAVYHTEPMQPGTEKAPADYWVQPQGDSCLVSVFADDKKNRYLMPVNHAIDQPRELTLSFGKDVTGLEKMDRKTGEWKEVKLDTGNDRRRIVLTLAPGDGEFLRALPIQK